MTQQLTSFPPLLGLLALATLGCQPKTVGETIRLMRSEAYVRVLETPNHLVELRYIPETLYYLTFSSLDTNCAYSKALIDSVKSNGYLGYGLMFILTLSPRIDTLPPTDYRNDVVFGQITGQENYRIILDQFQNSLKSKIWVEVDGAKRELRTHHMTNSWGMEKSRTFTLLFEPVDALLPGGKGDVSVVIENLVPGQGREKIQWHMPINRYDFIRG